MTERGHFHLSQMEGSAKVAEEMRLRHQRPANLPPVPDDGSVVSEAASRAGQQVNKEGKGIGTSAATGSRGNGVSGSERKDRSRSAERWTGPWLCGFDEVYELQNPSK